MSSSWLHRKTAGAPHPAVPLEQFAAAAFAVANHKMSTRPHEAVNVDVEEALVAIFPLFSLILLHEHSKIHLELVFFTDWFNLASAFK
jgi:hypothetical protein